MIGSTLTETKLGLPVRSSPGKICSDAAASGLWVVMAGPTISATAAWITSLPVRHNGSKLDENRWGCSLWLFDAICIICIAHFKAQLQPIRQHVPLGSLALRGGYDPNWMLQSCSGGAPSILMTLCVY